MRIINLGLSFVLAGAFSITGQAQTVNFSTLQIQMQKACPVVWEDLAVPINLVAIPFSNVWQSNQVDESEFIALYMTDYSVSNADAQLVANNVSAVAAVCGSYRIGLIDTLVANNALDTLIATETAASPDSLVVKPGAPNSSLVIASDGDLGVGTSSPGTLAYGEEASVHIKRLDGNASLLIEEANSSTAARGMLELKNNGGSYLTMKNTATNKEWFLSHENQSAGRFIISDGVNDGPELTLTTDGDLSLAGSLSASDLVVKGAGHKLLELESTDAGSPQLRLISDIADIRRVLAMNSARQIKSQIELGDNGIRLFGPSATEANTFASFDANGLETKKVSAKTAHITKGGVPFSSNVYADLIVQDNATSSDIAMLSLISGGSSNAQLTFGSDTNQFGGQLIYNNVTQEMNLNLGGSQKLSVNSNGSIDSSTGASLTAGGTWADASSRLLKNNIEFLSIESAKSTVMGLNPVSFNYIKNPQEPRLGFIAEDVPSAVAYNDKQRLSSMDIVAVLTKAVQEQQIAIDELKSQLEKLEK